MSDEARYVFDTNVIVSALLIKQGKPARAFHQALLSGEILISQPVLEELRDVLSRKKFDRYLSPQDREEFLQALIMRATLVETDEVIADCRDPKDNKFLELAVCGNARYLVTGDIQSSGFAPPIPRVHKSTL